MFWYTHHITSMATEGIFAVVVKEGRVQAGDEIEVLK